MTTPGVGAVCPQKAGKSYQLRRRENIKYVSEPIFRTVWLENIGIYANFVPVLNGKRDYTLIL
jgi:hypothetical protein